MTAFDRGMLVLLAIVVLGLFSAIQADSDNKEKQALEYKTCLEHNGGVLIQEYGSTIYYCAEVKRIKL